MNRNYRPTESKLYRCSWLTLWRPLLIYGYSYKATVPDRVKPPLVIFDIRALWRSAPSVRVPGCQQLKMTVA